MKLSGLNLHLTRQNKQNKRSMTDPPTNERDFASLIKQHSRIINKVSYFYATDKLPFDDLRQEIYVNIWLGLKQFRGDSKISTWIYRIAVNSALMALRSSKSNIETVSVDFGLLDLSSEIDDAQKENLQVLHSLINRLEDMEKAIILLCVHLSGKLLHPFYQGGNSLWQLLKCDITHINLLLWLFCPGYLSVICSEALRFKSFTTSA